MIPTHAKKVFSGILFDVYQWEQELYDGSTATFERAVRQGNAKILPVMNGRVLLCEQSQPDSDEVYQSLPGGRIEQGEEPLETAQRELLEETGLTSNDWEEFLKSPNFGHLQMDRRIFIARDCQKKDEASTDPGERIACKEISFEAFVALGKDPSFYDDLLKIKLLEASYDEGAREVLKQKLGL